MKKTYLIFPNPKDIYSHLSIQCTLDELNNELIDLELIDPKEHYSEFAWVIFEDGIMIQG
jgi:hypothetical protein